MAGWRLIGTEGSLAQCAGPDLRGASHFMQTAPKSILGWGLPEVEREQRAVHAAGAQRGRQVLDKERQHVDHSLHLILCAGIDGVQPPQQHRQAGGVDAARQAAAVDVAARAAGRQAGARDVRSVAAYAQCFGKRCWW